MSSTSPPLNSDLDRWADEYAQRQRARFPPGGALSPATVDSLVGVMRAAFLDGMLRVRSRWLGWEP